MKVETAPRIYELYEQFISTCILGGDSMLTQKPGTFTTSAAADAERRFIQNYIEGNENFVTKIRKQFDGADPGTLLLFAHVNWLWAMAPNDITPSHKERVVREILNNADISLEEGIVPAQGFGKAGQWLRQNKHAEICFLLLLVHQLLLDKTAAKLHTIADVKKRIEQLCLLYKDSIGEPDYEIDTIIWDKMPTTKLAICNILLHLSNPDEYEPIASDAHKAIISDTFACLLDREEVPEAPMVSVDKKIHTIRNRIKDLWQTGNFSFYDEELAEIWQPGTGGTSFEAFQAIQYKKAIILYGPPGTSKTHNAEYLAKSLIYRHFLQYPENIRAYFLENRYPEEGRVHYLQLHPGYSYEDFIGGIHFRNGNTVKEPGFLLKILDKARNDEYPHVLILDEINRVDLSRLFGELFSALEKRDTPIITALGDFVINVPKNLYVIGTMNEIDFSLERVDFALRRRFAWIFCGYNEEVLKEMLYTNDSVVKKIVKQDELDTFVARCSKLNEEITRMEDLGAQYQIGHTFFAEVLAIHQLQRELDNAPRLKLFRQNGPVKVLWDISIAPMLEAYMGGIDNNARTGIMDNFKTLFLTNE